MSEGEVLPDDHGSGVQNPADHPVEVGPGAPARKLPVEVDHEHRVDAVLCGTDGTLFQRSQGRRDGVRAEEDGGMGVEGHHHRRHSELTRALYRRRYELLVPPVDAVEDADGDDGAREVVGHLFQSVPDIHGHHTTTSAAPA